MRIRKKPWAIPELNECNFYVKNPIEYRGKWKDKFPVEQPLYLEIGCGKGTFVADMALKHPEINFIAIDIKSDMLGVARRTIVKEFGEKEVTNIILVEKNVEQINEIFSSDDRIERMYINFCNPWPRGKHNKRRLTYPKKLIMYKDFLVDKGEIHFKTDDLPLFEDSLNYFESCKYALKDVTTDLHSSNIDGGPVTEHENMFTQEGKLINYCTAIKK